MKKILSLCSCALIIGSMTLTAQNRKQQPASVIPTMDTPVEINMNGYLAGRIDDCIRVRVMGEDEMELVRPFRTQNETRRWQSEFWGKWTLGAIASYRYNHDPKLLAKIDNAVKGLLSTQLPNGYIGNYAPEYQLQHWDIWGRKYSMLGLLAYYDLTGDKKALEGARRVADHLLTQVGPGKVDIVTTGNYRGMASCSVLEPIMYLYNRTQDKKYLDFAQYIVAQWETDKGPMLISKALSGVPVAERFPHPPSWWSWDNGQKAYEMMSCYEGLLELYKVTKEPLYLAVVERTVDEIIKDEINIAGSGAAFECFYHGHDLQTDPAYHTMETCVTMTWMKLCQTLLRVTGNPKYADEIERTTYNALMASLKDDAGQISKYSPLEGHRVEGEHQSGMHINCCNANGPRAFALIPAISLMNSADRIYVNLYAPLTATMKMGNKNVIISQETTYPEGEKVTININPAESGTFSVALRIPSWSEATSVAVNGQAVKDVTAGSYVDINRQWTQGDKIEIQFDMRGRLLTMNGFQAIQRGPVVLARDSRFSDGFIDEASVVQHTNKFVELTPVKNKPAGLWMAFSAPLVLGTDLEGTDKEPKAIGFCDFASAGNTWERAVRYRVWLKQTLNVMRDEYRQY